MQTMMMDCGHLVPVLYARERAGRTACALCARNDARLVLAMLGDDIATLMVGVYSVIRSEDLIVVNDRVRVSVNDESGALEIHAPVLEQGAVVTIAASLPRGYTIRTAVEAVQNVVAAV